MSARYRRWRSDDIESIRRLLRDTWLQTYAKIIPPDDLLGYLADHYGAPALAAAIGDPDAEGYVAEVDGTVGGYAKTFHNRAEGRLYLQQLYVLPTYQGLGLGRQLMAMAAERAKALELDRVWVGVMVENTSAVSWYQRMGYTIVERTPFVMGKTTVDHYVGFVPIAGVAPTTTSTG